MSRILIRNADWVVTVDDDRRVIADGAVEIADERIDLLWKCLYFCYCDGNVVVL